MRRNSLLTVSVMMAIFVFFSMVPRVEALDITKIIEGTVKGIKNNSINIVCEPNGSEVGIIVNSDTVYNNVQKLTDLKAGDKIQVEYQKVQNRKLAITITKTEIES